MIDGRYRLGQIIRKLREDAGETQEQLGAILGHSHVAFSDIELGKTNLTLKDLAVITDHFNVSLVGIIEQAYRGTEPTVVSTDDKIKRILTELELNLADPKSILGFSHTYEQLKILFRSRET